MALISAANVRSCLSVMISHREPLLLRGESCNQHPLRHPYCQGTVHGTAVSHVLVFTSCAPQCLDDVAIALLCLFDLSTRAVLGCAAGVPTLWLGWSLSQSLT